MGHQQWLETVEKLRDASDDVDFGSLENTPDHNPKGSGHNDEAKWQIVQVHLKPPTEFRAEWLNYFQQVWEKPVDLRDLYSIPSTKAASTIRFIRHGLTGQVVDYEQVSQTSVELSAKNSLSLQRSVADKADTVRGKIGFFPFKPGGFDLEENTDTASAISDAALGVDEHGLYTIPPGFTKGMEFKKEGTLDTQADPDKWEAAKFKTFQPGQKRGNEVREEHPKTSSLNDIDDLLPTESSLLTIPANLPKSTRGEATKNWAHVVDVNQEMENFDELVPEMAFQYSFKLDNFQKEAIYHLENGESVFVAAHTSAGKTVVAEYAIALASKHMTRAIYTSPIKALSNQKFRDFKNTFEDVGILTGDVQVNPEANCLVMTTEILRSMLYRGADLIRDVEFVIFDEVHYVNDLERGVVWEEVIIMLPEHITLILLSATVPNTREFAGWVGRTKQKDIYVISTPKRPVPLEHYLWAGRDMYKIVNADKQFLSTGYRDAQQANNPPKEKPGAPGNGNVRGRGVNANVRGRGGDRGGHRGQSSGSTAIRGRGGARTMERRDVNVWSHVIGHLQKHEMLPVVVFVFSKKRCEDNADTLASRDLNSKSEKNLVHMVTEKAIMRLKEEDRNLPQIVRVRDLLSRGVAVHHGGLLPIVKEMVELLFARGLVKVLFATETFAMGVNMPARTVVFSGIRKHDGRSFRELLPGEYTQMAGRAGRRGLDKTGTVLIVSEGDFPEAATVHSMILGPPSKLQSQFRLTYNMILNLLRVETLKIEEMIKRSFSENANQRLMPGHQQEIDRIEQAIKDADRQSAQNTTLDEMTRNELERVHDALEQWNELTRQLHTLSLGTTLAKRIYCPGRVVLVKRPSKARHLGVLLNWLELGASPDENVFAILALAESGDHDVEKQAETANDLLPFTGDFQGMVSLRGDHDTDLVTASLTIGQIDFVSRHTIKLEPDKLKNKNAGALAQLKQTLDGCLSDVHGEWTSEVQWDRIRDFEFREILTKRDRCASQMKLSDRLVSLPDFGARIETMHKKYQLSKSMVGLRQMVSNENLELLPDYEQRIRVLREMGFIDASNSVLLKGRVACEIHSAHELILTELMLDNTLSEFEPEEIVSLLSAFVFDEKTQVEPVLSPHLEKGKQMVLQVAERVLLVQEKYQVVSLGEDDDFETRPRFHLMQVVYEWANGMTFQKIMELTDVLEGSIVRAIVRLDEVLRECKNAARTIGDASMSEKLETCRDLIKRDVVWTPSLYM